MSSTYGGDNTENRENYAKTIKKRLIDMNMTATELCRRVSMKTGKYFDDSYLSKIYRGVLSTKEMISAIDEILGIGQD